MGVAGSGKSTIASALARQLGRGFRDGDSFHSADNMAKMAGGQPLTSEDRIPWLTRLHDVMIGWHRDGISGVLTCSALKQTYRDILAKDLPSGSYRFVLLEAPVAVLAARMNQRPGHFMNPALLQSQLATLEMPADALRVDATQSPETVARDILSALNLI